ncbi:hypothetical protein ABE28_021920 [Peribacillus muralis]|uniref:Uncharacterized protein n=2 Tax=Peribacillus muralis TaxID=264697 RepID=A0A1B3XUW1_9BACI|nr:hypothetical protein ABE28_021920 [Peribacillus muralis]
MLVDPDGKRAWYGMTLVLNRKRNLYAIKQGFKAVKKSYIGDGYSGAVGRGFGGFHEGTMAYKKNKKSEKKARGRVLKRTKASRIGLKMGGRAIFGPAAMAVDVYTFSRGYYKVI